MRADRLAFAVTGLLLATPGLARAEGVTAYLPMNLEPEIERQIERVLHSRRRADIEAALRRRAGGIGAAASLPDGQTALTKVQRYLERYHRDYAVTHASATGAIAHGNSVMPNQHGMPVDSNYEFSAAAYAQPTDYFLISGGAIAYQGRVKPTGSMLEFRHQLGADRHWLAGSLAFSHDGRERAAQHRGADHAVGNAVELRTPDAPRISIRSLLGTHVDKPDRLQRRCGRRRSESFRGAVIGRADERLVLGLQSDAAIRRG